MFDFLEKKLTNFQVFCPDVILRHKTTYLGSKLFEILGTKWNKIDKGVVVEFSNLKQAPKSHPYIYIKTPVLPIYVFKKIKSFWNF